MKANELNIIATKVSEEAKQQEINRVKKYIEDNIYPKMLERAEQGKYTLYNEIFAYNSNIELIKAILTDEGFQYIDIIPLYNEHKLKITCEW